MSVLKERQSRGVFYARPRSASIVTVLTEPKVIMMQMRAAMMIPSRTLLIGMFSTLPIYCHLHQVRRTPIQVTVTGPSQIHVKTAEADFQHRTLLHLPRRKDKYLKGHPCRKPHNNVQ